MIAKNILALLSIVIAPVTAALAQNAPVQNYPEAFNPLAFMAGSCWEGPLPSFVGTSLGLGTQTVTHCVRWRLENQVLTDTLLMENLSPPVRGETNYYWDSETKTLRYVFWSIAGSYSTGTMKTNGDELVFDDERLFGTKGVVHFHTTWTPSGSDAFVQNRQRQNADGTWTNSAIGTFVRKPLR